MKNFIFIFFFLSNQVLAQVNIDSLLKIWNSSQQDHTVRLESLHKIAQGFLFSQPDSAFYYAGLQYQFALKKDLKKQMATALNMQGVSFYVKGDYANGMIYYVRSFKVYEEAGDTKGMAASLGNIGTLYHNQGNYAQAIDNYTRSLKIRERIDDKRGMASVLNNIGIIYSDQGNNAKAIEYYTASLKIQEEIGNKKGLANSLGNIGSIYSKLGETAKAIEYFARCLKIMIETGNKKGEATALYNIGSTYADQGETVKAMDYYTRSLKLREETGDKKGVAGSLCSIGNIYRSQGDFSRAIIYSGKALALAMEVGSAIATRDAAQSLYESYNKTGQYQQALINHELYIQMRDSIKSEENQKEVIRQEYKYTYEKQAATDSIKAAESKKVSDAHILAQEEQIAREKTQRFALYGGMGLLFVFGGFMYNRFRVTRRQKKVIEHQKTEVETQRDIATRNQQEAELQKELVEEKNKEITDSINYAKRLQDAILPSRKLLAENLKDGFVLFKPKDVVSGDFYFMDVVEEEVKKLIYYIAADCTGHGVPGAMVSIVGANGLKRCIQEFRLRVPGEILDKLSEIVTENFSQSEEKIRDGMDLALCCLEIENDKAVKVHFAGANNPLWIIRKGEIIEIKANKQPIGLVENKTPFTTHTIELQKGDTIYTFTDGYQDQFGGEKGKKFKAAKLKEMLLSIQGKIMDEQKEIINASFEKWRGDLEQVDDVCIIGVRIGS